MASKTYYEQNYPTTKYEYSSRGYRNERLHSGDVRKKIQYKESPPVNTDYQYYENFPEVEKDDDVQWNYPGYSVRKHKSTIYNTAKRSSSSGQPVANTPRYYRNMAHRRPSALCLPVLAQPESTVRRKSKSQSRVNGVDKDQKNVRYRVKHHRHHLLPPPPVLRHDPMQNIEQTDVETSSGDGGHSLQSHTQSSGSLSVDITSQVESLNQSFNAVAEEHRGKKIVYGNLEPVYSHVELAYSDHIKPRRVHRRHSRRIKHSNDHLENLGQKQLWALPEESLTQEVWSDKVEPDWMNFEPENSHLHSSNLVSQIPKHRPKRHHHHHRHHHLYDEEQLPPVPQQLMQPPAPPPIPPPQPLMMFQKQSLPHQSHLQQLPQQMQQPSPLQPPHLSQQLQPNSITSKILDQTVRVTRPRTQGSRESGGSRDSQEQFINEDKKISESLNITQSGKPENLSFLENLFSEVFAQGGVDNMSKKTRLDFIKEAYDKYCSSLQDEKVVDENLESKEESNNLETQQTSRSQVNLRKNDYNQHIGGFINTVLSDSLSTEKSSILNKENAVPDGPVKINLQPRPPSHNKTLSNSINKSSNEQSVSNFLLSVKPRRRTINIEADSQERDSIPRFPNLIENMSARYMGSTNLGKKSLPRQPENSQNQTNISLTSESGPVQKRTSTENSYSSNQININENYSSMSQQKGLKLANEQHTFKSESLYANQDMLNSQFSASVLHQNADNNYERADKNDSSKPCNFDSVQCTVKDTANKFGEKYNFDSLGQDLNKLNVSVDNKDYSNSMESNYLTIKRCQEILNQVKENFDEDVKKNPDVFQSEERFKSEINEQEIFCVSGLSCQNPNMFIENTVKEKSPQKSESLLTKNEKEIHFSHPNYYENHLLHYQGEEYENLKLLESKENVNESVNTQNDQSEFYLSDGRHNFDNFNDYVENITNCNVRTDEVRVLSSVQTDGTKEVSSYETVDQDKVKQFIHSLTGFDAVHGHENKGKRDMNDCAEDYQGHDSKYPYESQDSFSNMDQAKFSMSADYFNPEHQLPHRHHPYDQQSQEHQHLGPKGVEIKNLEKRQHYSIPQRKEIERMQQDSQSGHNISHNKEKQESLLNYKDFPCEVPNRNVPSPSEINYTYQNEIEKNLEHFQLHKSQNNLNLPNNEKYQIIGNEHLQHQFYSQNDSKNFNYPYEYNYNNFSYEQMENIDFHSNQNPYRTASMSAPAMNVEKQDILQKTNHCLNNDPNSSDVGFSDKPSQQFSDQEVSNNPDKIFYNVNYIKDQHYSNNINNNNSDSNNNDNEDSSYNSTTLNSQPTHSAKNEENFGVHHITTSFENELPLPTSGYDTNMDDPTDAVLKRKYYYMPSKNSDGAMDNTVSNQSCYKSYIENLIDNSLQTPENDPPLTCLNVKQGTIIPNTNDVVELETDKAIDLVMNESSCQMDSKLCQEITQRLTDTLVQSNKDVRSPCLVALEEPVYLQQLKKLRWDHLRHIQREVKRLESLERFLDTCGCGHMMYTKNTNC